jgi:lipopolysaccharide/colanic/teichoic acid biosynthesis glycosyltransferase
MSADSPLLIDRPQIRWDLAHTSAETPSLPVSAGWYLTFKAVADFILAFGLFLVTLPLMLLLALLVKLTSRGPAFYSQMRVGRHGRPFRIHKLRTMTHNCEQLTGAQWSKPGDSRVTPLGRILRATHLDELPQLWNVLVGDMSLVGPRPERPEFVPTLEEAIPGYRDRLQVRPGVTGLAQVQVPPDTDLNSVRRKLCYDLYYIQRMGPWLDVQILLSTGLKVLHIPFKVSRVLFRVPGAAVVENGKPDDRDGSALRLEASPA